MFNFKKASDLLAGRISKVSHVAATFILVHDIFATNMDNIAAATGAWVVMQGLSFILKSWSDGLPAP